jgi:hypothetical protein
LSLDQPPEGEDLAVVLINQQDRFENMLNSWETSFRIPGLAAGIQQALNAQNVSFADLEGIKISGDLISADKAKIEITHYFRNSVLANKAAAALKPVVTQIPAKREGSPFECTVGMRSRGSAVIVELELVGLKSWLSEVFPAGAEAPQTSSEVTTSTAQ